MKAISKFFTNEEGLETIEYSVMTALIVGAIITAIGLMVTAVQGRFGTVAGVINGIT